MKKIKNMNIDKILKEYEPKHEGILKSKAVEREKKITGRWNIALCKNLKVEGCKLKVDNGFVVCVLGK